MTYQEVQRMIQQFEACTLPKEEWTHRAHLIMALWYIYHEPLHQARVSIKEGIKRYNLSVGGQNTDESGYHETITEFYIQLISQYQSTSQTDHFISLLEGMEQQPFVEKDFPLRYYSKTRLMSKEARKIWLTPDLQELFTCVFTPL